MKETPFSCHVLILSAFLIWVYLPLCVSVPSVSGVTYTWKARTWSSCFSQVRCGEGHRIREVACQESSGFIVADSNCDDSKKPITVESCFRVCEQHKNVLRWRIEEWSPCIASYDGSYTTCIGAPLAGVAHRKVSCAFGSKQRVVDSSACENFWDKPDTEMPCSLDCPQHCIVTRRNVSCHLDECPNLKTKEGYDVIVAPTEGGLPCPESELRQPVCFPGSDECYEFREKKKRYLLKVGEWGPCSEFEDNFIDTLRTDISIRTSLQPVIGIKRRNVTCLTDEGVPTNLSFCNVDQMPVLVRQCVVPVHCRTSPWSEWRVKREGCITSDGKVFPEIRSRLRKLVQMPLGPGSEPCPPLYEERSISQDLPSCYKYQWLPLEWSDCEIRVHGPHKEVRVVRPTCGSGLQYRNITCVRANDMAPVDEERCREIRPSLVQRCTIPCRQNCQVSDWSRWGPCNFNKGATIFKRNEIIIKRHVRSVLVRPTNGGDVCPHLEEVDHCNQFEGDLEKWQYGRWGDCAVAGPTVATCGLGNRTRNKTCVRMRGDPLGNTHCDHHQAIGEELSQQCKVPCPNDCLLSEWSEWSVCSKGCVVKKEGLKIRNRTVLAVTGKAGAECPVLRTEKAICGTIRCEPFKWMPKEWSSCRLKNESSGCGVGIQTRELYCTKEGNLTRSERMCSYTLKPDTEQKCQVPCPVDCLTTNFSDWTPCQASCGKDGVQNRHRLVLQSPRNGGQACPESLLEERTCSKETCLRQKSAGKSEHRWTTGPWSKCHIPIIEQHCGMGFQVRNVSCIDQNDSEVEPHHCLSSSSQPPSPLRSCEITCSNGCVLTVWSAWSPCGYNYHSTRTRHRELVGTLSEPSDCKFTSKRVEEEACPVMPTSVVLIGRSEAHWMSCIVSQDNSSSALVNGQLVEHICGGGYKYMFDMERNSETGTGPGLESDYCWQDCPVDCQMSEWGIWSECDVPCGRGFRERKRNILVPSNSMGRPCPDVVNDTEIQRDMCHIVCSNFHWSVGGWSECRLSEADATCGNGMQFRSVKCLDKRTDQKVDEKRCDPLERPDSSLPCRIHWPGECVVSPWEVTRKCTEPCSNQDYQELKRKILRHPSDPASEPCPPLVSRTPCVLNDTCFMHSFVEGPFGSCVFREGEVCGEGVMKKPVLCMRSDGRQVDAVLCEKIHKSLTSEEPSSKPCYIQCPIDCVMSDWSAWNTTECSACGHQGTLSRTRYVLQSPSDTGQPCPSEVEQKKPCPFKPCYHWKHSNWSTCDLEGVDCGYGVRRHVVDCIRYDGLQVDKTFCLTINVSFSLGNWLDHSWLVMTQEHSQEEEFCHVPCPGDCVVSEWSRWSHCHKNCRIGQIVGYQTSSRKILYPRQNLETCPTQLWRTRPCWGNDCNFFRWRLRGGSLTCEGRDGTIAEGGCSAESPPCEYWCDKLGGRCNTSTGLCHCEIYGIPQGPVMTGPSSAPCSVIRNGPHPPSNHSAPTPQIHLKYYPDDEKVSFWMYAMITIGSAFVIFVAVTVYLMCRSSLRQRSASVERQPSVRRRVTTHMSTSERTKNDGTQNGSRHFVQN